MVQDSTSTKREWFDEGEFTKWLLGKYPDKDTEIREALYDYIANFNYDWFIKLPKESALEALKEGVLGNAYTDYELMDLIDSYESIISINYLLPVYGAVELNNLIETYMNETGLILLSFLI